MMLSGGIFVTTNNIPHRYLVIDCDQKQLNHLIKNKNLAVNDKYKTTEINGKEKQTSTAIPGRNNIFQWN